MFQRIQATWKEDGKENFKHDNITYTSFNDLCVKSPLINLSLTSVNNRINFSNVCQKRVFLLFLRNTSYSSIVEMIRKHELEKIIKEADEIRARNKGEKMFL